MAGRTRDETEKGGRTAARPGGRAAAAAGRDKRGVAAKRGATATRHSVPGRKQEIVALVLFGAAVFLIFVLVADEKGGFVGRGVEAGLTFAFGRLAFLVPLTLLALTVTTVFGVRLRHSYWFAGAMVFLFGLFLLMAGGVPPFGGHGEDNFVRADFEVRAGGLGEALYALFYHLVGTVGVGIIGWVTVLAGFSLATGVTVRRLGRGTRRAAQAVRTTAERSTLVTRRREEGVAAASGSALPAGAAASGGGPLDDPYLAGFGPRIGPVDLVGEGDSLPETIGAAGGISGPFAGEFDEWSDGRPASRSPLAAFGGGGADRGGGILDGAEAFADIYGAHGKGATAASSAGLSLGAVAAGREGEAASGLSPTSGESSRTGLGASVAGSGLGSAIAAGAAGAGGASLAPQGGESEVQEVDARQETLPGLAREPRQIVLPVEQPSYVLPTPDLLRKSTPAAIGRGTSERDTAAVLLQALSQFGVEARVIGMVVGPRVTRYELQLAPGTKVARVSGLKDDLAYALASTEIRILAPIPGKSAVGVEVPNQRPDFVTLGDIYREFPKSAGPLMVWLGKDISGKAVYTDLTRLPHLLIAGTTGSGKSGCVNCLVSSVLLRSAPDQVRMIMIDPKKVELSHYDRIPHLLVPVVTNMKDAAGVLHNVAKEMEDRYELMELEHARNLAEMNKARARRGERSLPYILIVIDELADLMMVSPQEVEDCVIRLAQKSRAVGIHLVVATQRPSADVITGMIKANIPSRIAFAVSSQTDSRVILDVNGAETLLGMGDMLFKPLGSSHLQRVQGAYITEEEIAILVNHWRHQAEPEFREELLRRPSETKKSDGDLFSPDSDELLFDAAQLVIETGSASVSMLQRRLRVGYTRAGRLIDMLERRGIVGPWEGSKPRQILVDPDEFENVLAVLRAEEHLGDVTNGD
jgi:DNA segregation ATPase FtsK/SpoIIIE, S-DNA-T family